MADQVGSLLAGLLVESPESGEELRFFVDEDTSCTAAVLEADRHDLTGHRRECGPGDRIGSPLRFRRRQVLFELRQGFLVGRSFLRDFRLDLGLVFKLPELHAIRIELLPDAEAAETA